MRAALIGVPLLLLATQGAIAADDIEEAVPLEAPPAATPAPDINPAANANESYQYRGYLLGEWSNLIPESESAMIKNRDLSLAEANLSGSASYRNGVQLFGDVTGTYRFRSTDGTGMVNQAGVRYRQRSGEFLLGKERARRSPGMVVSPSDFLYPNDSLPGLREQRQGVWQARVSWQTLGQSADVLYLPNLNVDEHGLPDNSNRRQGAALRYFRQSSAFDFSASYASIESDHAAGFWAQTYIARTTKLYLDAAYLESDRILNQTVQEVTKVLAGASYEGYSDGTFRLEAFANNRGLDGTVMPPPPPAGSAGLLDNIFYRRLYGIASVQFSNLWRESVFTLNHIRALDYPEWVWVARYELPLSRHQAVGTMLGRFNNLVTQPYATLVSLDWKYTY